MRLESHSKVDVVHHSIESRILNGDWRVGDQIPTEAELATEFNCSRGTVSKAIAQLTHDGLVQRRTRAGTRVLDSSVNRNKERIQLDACAFIFPSEQHEGICRIGQGFQQAAHEVGRRIITLASGTDFRKEAEIVGRLNEFDVKGAVVYAVMSGSSERLHFERMLQACRFPVVLADIIFPNLRLPDVVIDGFHAGYTMTRHLLSQGLRRIGFLMVDAGGMLSSCSRYLGYRHAMEEAGAEERPEWVLLEPMMQINFGDPVIEELPVVKRFLEGASGLEGLVCSDDFLALGCLSAARELGIRVPEQLKVVGGGDFTIAARSEPPLTTYRVSYEEIGRQSFKMLNSLLLGESLSTTEVQIRGSLVVRKSG
jgi:DNA-binding LacI/PurR family transcriptional regulator